MHFRSFPRKMLTWLQWKNEIDDVVSMEKHASTSKNIHLNSSFVLRAHYSSKKYKHVQAKIQTCAVGVDTDSYIHDVLLLVFISGNQHVLTPGSLVQTITPYLVELVWLARLAIARGRLSSYTPIRTDADCHISNKLAEYGV